MSILSWILTPLINKRVAAIQNGFLETHIAEVEHTYQQMRGWRHDYHNHMQTLKAHLHLKQYDEMDEYLTKLAVDLLQVDTIIKSGNVTVDAILNSKLSIARERKINVNAKAFVPEHIKIPDTHLCVIIGNLLDNAMEACEKVEDINCRFIRVYVDVLKRQLYISVSNSMGSGVKKRGRIFRTTKVIPGHGFGLIRIDQYVKKHNGYVNRTHEEGVFATEVMLPI